MLNLVKYFRNMDSIESSQKINNGNCNGQEKSTSSVGEHLLSLKSSLEEEHPQRVLGLFVPGSFTIGSAMFFYLSIVSLTKNPESWFDAIVNCIACLLFTIGSAAMFFVVR